MSAPKMLNRLALVPKAQFALTRVKNQAGLSTTDAVNRAIQFYDLAENYRVKGVGLYVREGDDFRELQWEETP